MEFKELKQLSSNLNILYVEDDEDTLAQTSKMLSNYFAQVDTANNGEDGFEKYFNNSYDMVLTDISMPYLNGLKMIEKIKEKDQNIPIAIFSAYDDSEYFIKAIELGVDGYLLKPYNINQLNNLIEKLISKNSTKDEKINLENGFIWNINQKFITNSYDETIYKLTNKEILLIEYLALHKNSIIKIEEIENHIYDDYLESTKRIRNLISRLKSKLGFDIIESVYGYGYRLKVLDI
jgi:DNA-binding response OmpR family regulator